MLPPVLPQPVRLAPGPDGNVWFTDDNGNGIGYLGYVTPSTGAITRFAATPAASNPFDITAGPGGNLWFTESTRNQIGRVVPSTHQVTEFPLPTGATGAYGIAVGGDNALWFTEAGTDRIGRFDPQTSTMQDFADTGASVPGDIVGGPDGGMWFTDSQGLTRMDVLTKAVTHHPYLGSVTRRIALGPDQNLWIVDPSGNTITRYSIAANTFTSLPVPFGGGPMNLVAGTNNDVWYVEGSAPNIGRVNTATLAIDEFPTGQGDRPAQRAIAIGPDGKAWISDEAGSQLASMSTIGGPLTFAPPVVPHGASAITVGPDHNLWLADTGDSYSPYYDFPNTLLRVDTATHAITAFPVPNPSGLLAGIASGPDGRVWFTDQVTGSVNALTPGTGATTVVSLPQNPQPYPRGIVAGRDGRMWFTEAKGALASVDPTSYVVTEYPVPFGSSVPDALVAGLDGSLWFTDPPNSRIGRLDSRKHTFAMYAIPSGRYGWDSIAVGPDGNIWWTEQGGAIATIDVKTSVITEFPVGSNTAYAITAGPDKAMWFTTFGTNPYGPAISRFDLTTHAITTLPFQPAAYANVPGGIITGLDKNLWFGDVAQVGEVVLQNPR